MKNKIVMISIVLIALVSLCGCIFDSPYVYVVSQGARTDVYDTIYGGVGCTVYIDVTVYNRGGDGEVTVWTRVTQYTGNQLSRKQTIYINGEERVDLTFTYQDVSCRDAIKPDLSYRVWVEQ